MTRVPIDSRLRQASPIVVIGMHRSGTRLLAQLLDRLGVFMGADQQADSESVSFMLLNEVILHQCGAFWSEPMSAHFLLSQPEIAEGLAEGILPALEERFEDYLGTADHSPGGGTGADPLFGWKDPRNTFTLPVWRQLFPRLRVIHIVRHGVDVAASLARRHARALREATGEEVPSALVVIRDHALGVLSSRRGWNLAEALTMWEQYVDKARIEIEELGERALEIRFEDLLAQPARTIAALARFCGTEAVDDAALVELVAGRALAFRRDPELVEFAGRVSDTLARHGYAP